MIDKLWDSFVCLLTAIFLPVICAYHVICENPFLNVSVKNATGLENAANVLLVPFQYLCAGKEAFIQENGQVIVKQKFTYDKQLYIKSVAALSSLPITFPLGVMLKWLSLFSTSAQNHLEKIKQWRQSQKINSNLSLYSSLEIPLIASDNELFPSQGLQRKPGDENHLSQAKECLKGIISTLNDSQILWWVDCGTLLGTYRYGGIIPWDNDIDIALLLPDFENARRAFNRLDPTKYMVQDWSGRDFPNTFMKIYVKETGDMIDIYFYDVDFQKKTLTYICSLDHSIFFFEWWKDGERRFTKPISFDQLFPLKQALFDGIIVNIPNKPIPFLQRYYGENLSPVKIFDPVTNRFEKDLTHPYWQSPNVH